MPGMAKLREEYEIRETTPHPHRPLQVKTRPPIVAALVVASGLLVVGFVLGLLIAAVMR